MGEVRFEVFDKHNHNECVYDTKIKEYWSLESVVELLNQLNDENEDLKLTVASQKEHIHYLQDTIKTLRKIRRE